jgi:membrane protein YqaA with SNARE-associated domain
VKAPTVPAWLARLVSFIGGGGLFVIAFLDSSVLSFPFVTDLIFIEFVIRHPRRMPYYAAMAAAGSLAGGIWLYLLAKKGGEAYRKRHHQGPGRIQALVHRHAFLSVFLPSILPPPFPFKAFVIAEGATQVPLRTFLIGALFGRGFRYIVEGVFAIKYGNAVASVMLQHKLMGILVPIVLIGVIYALARWLLKPPREAGQS